MKITAEIPELTPEQLAELFWQMDDSEQARFFGTLGACSMGTPTQYGRELGTYHPLDMQMCYTASKCTPNGLRVMEIIGQFASGERLQPYLEQWQKVPTVMRKGEAKL